jgi:predicted nuclease of predicted toxin-antitoxin system
VKLLLDENLPPRLVATLGEFFPDSRHVSEVDLASRPDEEVWEHAKASGFTLVSKDSDFQQLSFVRGHPPKVIWVRLGNCTVREIESLLLSRVEAIRIFIDAEEAAVLLLS